MSRKTFLCFLFRAAVQHATRDPQKAFYIFGSKSLSKLDYCVHFHFGPCKSLF